MDNGTPERRRCEICNRPLARHNTTDICASRNRECERVKAERYRRANGVPAKVQPTCSHPGGCPELVHGNDLCDTHGARVKRTGDLGPAELIRKPVEIRAGEVFGLWTTLEDYVTGSGRIFCRCECGNKQYNDIGPLRDGKPRSCGCVTPARGRRYAAAGPYLRAGEVYGRLTVLEDVRHAKDLARCSCECGGETEKRAYAIKGGNTRSCGCMRRENNLTHGLSGHPLYQIWHNMIQRCTNPDDQGWENYGGRGITVCERWQGLPDGLLNFAADMGERPPGFSLDRLDNDKGYEKDNVAWNNAKRQAANRRSIRTLTTERDALATELARVRRLLGDS